MTTPPPYGSAPGQPSGYSGQPGQQYPQSYPGPASGAQPAYGAPSGAQPAYGAQSGAQPAYGAQPGYPAGYPGSTPAGYPGFGAPAGAARPGMATAAAVLAFVFGGFAIIAAIGSLAVSGLSSAASDLCTSAELNDPNYAASCRAVSGYSGFFKVISILLIVVAILLIWGGVTTLTGKNTQILVIGCGIYIIGVIALIIAGGGFGFSSIIGFVAPILILVFLFNPATRAWVRAKGGKTF